MSSAAVLAEEETRRPLRHPQGWLLVAVAVAALVWQGWQASRDMQRLRAQRSGLAALVTAAQAAAGAMSAEDRTRHAQLELLARTLAVPWGSLLDAFESQAGGSVALQRLSHDALTGRLALTASAPDAAAFARYTQALGKMPPLRGAIGQMSLRVGSDGSSQFDWAATLTGAAAPAPRPAASSAHP